MCFLTLVWFVVESRHSNLVGDGRAWEVDGRAQALVGPGLATPLILTRPSLVVLKNGLRHLVPHLILHLVKYRLLILFKMADHTSKAKFNFSI